MNGVADGTRTHDNRNHNPGLYQLSYSHRWTMRPRAVQRRTAHGARIIQWPSLGEPSCTARSSASPRGRGGSGCPTMIDGLQEGRASYAKRAWGDPSGRCRSLIRRVRSVAMTSNGSRIRVPDWLGRRFPRGARARRSRVPRRRRECARVAVCFLARSSVIPSGRVRPRDRLARACA